MVRDSVLSINEFVSAAVDLAITGYSKFDFDLEDDDEGDSQESCKAADAPSNISMSSCEGDSQESSS